MDQLNEIAKADLTGCATVAEIAERENWKGDANGYAIRLSEYLRTSEVPIDAQRERLAALCSVGALADRATADTLGQHLIVLEALFQKFAREAHDLSNSVGGRGRDSVHVERYLNAGLKAQRAALACLSALAVLRDRDNAGAPTTPTTPAASGAPIACLSVVGDVVETT